MLFAFSLLWMYICYVVTYGFFFAALDHRYETLEFSNKSAKNDDDADVFLCSLNFSFPIAHF